MNGRDLNPDFRAIFESGPDRCLVLLPDAPRFTIVAVSDAYAHAISTMREALLQRGLFEAFPDGLRDPCAVAASDLSAALSAVVRERVAHQIAPQRDDVARSKEGGREERWWSQVFSPVLAANGDVLYVILRIEDVTRYVCFERSAEEALQLRHAKAIASGVLSSCADALIAVDERGRMTIWNESAERMFGYSRAEAVGAPLDILLPERYRSDHRMHLARFASERESARAMDHQAALGLRKNGQEFPISATISKLELGGRRHMTVAVRDVTEQRRYENEQKVLADVGAVLASQEYGASLQKVVHLSVEAIADFCVLFAVDEGGTVRRVAAASSDPAHDWCAELMMELPSQPRPGHPVWQVLSSRKPVIRELKEELYESLAQSPEHLRALRVTRPRSSLAVPLLVADDCIGVFAFASCLRLLDERDVRLAGEVARRCAFFIENTRLHLAQQRAVRARDEVLGVVAHDLRNPLGTILMATANLRPPLGWPDRRNAKPLDVITRAATRMNRIVQDLLDVTRVEAGQLSMQRGCVAVRELVTEAVESQAAHARARALELRLDLAHEITEVWADRERVCQVFDNLIGNAVKFTREGSISVGAKPMDGEVLFWVADTGPGIPPESVPRLYDRFWQARETSRGGAGLGLAIVKGIVEAHGGRVWVESDVGAGSTFFFTLPMTGRENASPSRSAGTRSRNEDVSDPSRTSPS